MNVAGVNWLSTFEEFGRYLEKTRDESKGQKRWLLCKDGRMFLPFCPKIGENGIKRI